MKKMKPYFEVIPVLFIIMFILVYGIFEAFLQSLGYFPVMGIKEITTKYYIEVLQSKEFIRSLLYSIYISLVSSLLSIIIGVFMARAVLALKEYNQNKYIENIYKIPVIVPHITVALFAIIFLSDTGVFSRILYNIGLKNSMHIFGNILYHTNGLGIIIAYIWKEGPYILLTVLAVLKRIDDKYEKVAINLGASRWYAFRKVTIPILMPTILSTFIIIFSFSFGAYEIPFLLGSTVPKTLPIQAFIEYQNPDMSNRPLAMAINIIIIAISLAMVVLFNYVVKKIYKIEDI